MSVAGLGHCQDPHYQESPRNAAILSDTRYLSGDGTFGASYKQEDGVEFKEESDEFGNRRGSYSYIDPNGERRTVTYTAGKNGFQVFSLKQENKKSIENSILSKFCEIKSNSVNLIH